MNNEDLNISINSTPEDVLKKNIINIAKHHREHCHEPCNCSLCLLRQVAEQAGIKFTDEEKHIFY
jgi:hypothetical protein